MAANMQPQQGHLSLAYQQVRPHHPPLLTPSASNDGPAFNALHDGPRQGNGIPSLPLQARQTRPPAPSQYRPAVLRPTERPARHFPLTPPQSSSNSLDSMRGAEPPMPLSRQSTADSAIFDAMGEGRWLGDHALGKVTGTPTRDHWKVSSQSRLCLVWVVLCILFFSLVRSVTAGSRP